MIFHASLCRATPDPGGARKDALVGVDAQCPHRSHGVSAANPLMDPAAAHAQHFCLTSPTAEDVCETFLKERMKIAKRCQPPPKLQKGSSESVAS